MRAEVQFEGKTYAVSTNGLVYLEIDDKDVQEPKAC
jgi:hypothetical protein